MLTRDQQAVLQFVQGTDEPFYMAWERYNELVQVFPNHGFSREDLILNFLDGLTIATRNWVEGGNGTASFYNQSADDAYWKLDDLAGYDYHCWNTPTNFYDSEEYNYDPALWQDPPNPSMECFPEFQPERTSIPEATWHHDGDQRRVVFELLQTKLDYLRLVLSRVLVPLNTSIEAMSKRDALQRTQLQIDDIQRELVKLREPPNYSIEAVMRKVACGHHKEEPSTSGGYFDDFDDDDVEEAEDNAWMEYEQHEESSPNKTNVIMPPPYMINHSFKDPMWPAPPPPSFGPHFEASHAHQPKWSPPAQMSSLEPYLAKLEGVYNRDPWDVLYDTYYGRRPLFDGPQILHRQAIDDKFSASWEATQVFSGVF